MGAEQSNGDQAAFNDRVGRATIRNLWVAIAALIAAILIGLLQLPWVQKWIDADHPGLRSFISRVQACVATAWTLPWLAWIFIIATAYGLGVLTVLFARSARARERFLQFIEPLVLEFNPYWGRDTSAPASRPTNSEKDDAAAMAALAVPHPKAPEPEQMEIEQVVTLSHMAHRVRNVLAMQIAAAVKAPEVTIIAALQQLQAWGLVTSGVAYWALTQDGIAYVNKHRAIFLEGRRPSK